jgi:uncharacterized protein YrrD
MVEYELHIGAHVKSKDGKKLGSIQRFIVHPDTSQVDGFLLGKGHLTSERIVAVGQVESADADGVMLKLDAHQAEQLPVYIQEQMVRSPGNLTYQGRWGAQATIAGSGENWTMRAAGSDLSTIDSKSMFTAAPIGMVEAQNIDDLPEDSVLLNKGTDVVGSDGTKIGHVDEIFVDSERRITGFLVKSGHIFTHDVRVPMSSVAGISHSRVRLNVTAEQAASASRSGTEHTGGAAGKP